MEGISKQGCANGVMGTESHGSEKAWNKGFGAKTNRFAEPRNGWKNGSKRFPKIAPLAPLQHPFGPGLAPFRPPFGTKTGRISRGLLPLEKGWGRNCVWLVGDSETVAMGRLAVVGRTTLKRGSRVGASDSDWETRGEVIDAWHHGLWDTVSLWSLGKGNRRRTHMAFVQLTIPEGLARSLTGPRKNWVAAKKKTAYNLGLGKVMPLSFLEIMRWCGQLRLSGENKTRAQPELFSPSRFHDEAEAQNGGRIQSVIPPGEAVLIECNGKSPFWTLDRFGPGKERKG